VGVRGRRQGDSGQSGSHRKEETMERARVGFYNWDAASFLDEERRERRGGVWWCRAQDTWWRGAGQCGTTAEEAGRARAARMHEAGDW
jgi:hypothetical protein